MTTLPVPAQTDAEYSAIASNQCSWAAAEFLLKSADLRNTFRTNPDEFTRIYKECLERASRNRAAAGMKHLYGENIDTSELVDYYKTHHSAKFNITDKITIKRNESDEFLDILHPDLKREFYTREYRTLSIEGMMAGIFGSQSLLVSRHGQSLVVIPFYGRYLICDSHLHQAMVLSYADTVKHILMDEGGHLHLTVLFVM